MSDQQNLNEERRWLFLHPLRLPHYGRRSAALFVLAAISVLWGIGLLISPPAGHTRTLYDSLFSIMPSPAWGIVWISGGVFAATVAWLQHPKDRGAYAVVSTLFATWAAGTAIDWLMTGFPRGWVTASLMALISGLIIVISGWPE